jgi:hypothetical protein
MIEGKAFDDTLPKILVDRFPAQRKAHDTLDAGFELFDEPIAESGINGFVVLRRLNRLNIGWRQTPHFHTARGGSTTLNSFIPKDS